MYPQIFNSMMKAFEHLLRTTKTSLLWCWCRGQEKSRKNLKNWIWNWLENIDDDEFEVTQKRWQKSEGFLFPDHSKLFFEVNQTEETWHFLFPKPQKVFWQKFLKTLKIWKLLKSIYVYMIKMQFCLKEIKLFARIKFMWNLGLQAIKSNIPDVIYRQPT